MLSFQRVPHVDCVVVGAGEHHAAGARQAAAGEGRVGCRRHVLRQLLVGSQVKQACRLVLRARGERLAGRMELAETGQCGC